MKTQIIQLNHNEDIISVRDKMNWSQVGRILLVWPSDGLVLNRKLDLNLAARHAASLGAQLALVTHDQQVCFYARQLGISVFDNLRAAQDARWNPIKISDFQNSHHGLHNQLGDLARVSHPKTTIGTCQPVTRVACLVISIMAILLLGIFILPGARITFTPVMENQAMIFNIIADPTASSINYFYGTLPATYRDVVIEGQGSTNATGSVKVPYAPSAGELRFTNNSDHSITIPASTTVSTSGSDPVKFLIVSQGDIRVDPYDSVIIPARALKPGSSGNLTADELVVIDGNLGTDLTATNPQAMVGGTDASVASPTAQDLSGLRQRLTSKLTQDALAELRAQLPEGDILITSTITNVETLAETTSPPVGEPGNKLALKLQLSMQVQVVSGKTLTMLVNPIMDSYTPTGFSPLTNSLKITQLTRPATGEDGKAGWTVRATRKLIPAIPAERISSMIRGRTVSQSMLRLATSLPLAGQADIKLTPGWWPRLPLLAMRIEVRQTGVQ